MTKSATIIELDIQHVGALSSFNIDYFSKYIYFVKFFLT